MSMDGWTVASPVVVVGAQATQLGENSTKFKHSYFFLPSVLPLPPPHLLPAAMNEGQVCP